MSGDMFELAERIANYAQRQADHNQPVYADPIREMLNEESAIFREQYTVAMTRSQRFRDALMRIAARMDDSEILIQVAEIQGIIADTLEISVKELEARLEAD